MWRVALCIFLLTLTTACQETSVGKRFFKEGFVARDERLEAYPLEDQWRIFLYANQVVHPPLKDMALPIAKKGKPALDYILEQLEQPNGDLDFRDSMVVFNRMQWGGYYNVCGDEQAMTAIRRNESRITHAGWRDVYQQMLRRLCAERGNGDRKCGRRRQKRRNGDTAERHKRGLQKTGKIHLRTSMYGKW